MRFLVNKDSSPAAKPLGTVSHSAAVSVVTFFFFFFKGLGHQPGRIYQKPSNWPTHGPDANKFGLNEVHLMLLYSSFEMQHKTFTLISDEGTNKTNFLALF